MNRWIMAGLVVLNVLLGAGIYLRYGGEKTAIAAGIGGNRGDVATVAGFNNNQGIIYVFEANTGRLLAIRTDPINHKVELVAGKDVLADLQRLK